MSDKDLQRNVSGVCIFCEIAKGTVPASMVFVDEHVLAFLSPEQPNPYKVLIITREHAATLYDLTDEQALIFSNRQYTSHVSFVLFLDAKGLMLCNQMGLLDSKMSFIFICILSLVLHVRPSKAVSY